MAQLVSDLLQDLGLLGASPGTFPELLTWICTFAIAAALVAGTFKTLFWCISYFGSYSGRR